MHCRMLGSILEHHPLDVSGTTLPLVVTTKKKSPDIAKLLSVENPWFRLTKILLGCPFLEPYLKKMDTKSERF